MSQSITITLAGNPYTIQPLTLGQVEDLNVAVVIPASTDAKVNIRNAFARAIDILVAALSENFPDLTPEALRKMPISQDELREAQLAILNLSGLVSVEAPQPGELHAAA